METKSKTETLKALKEIIAEEKLDNINTISGDAGLEFVTNKVALGDMDIKYFTMRNEHKGMIVEERISVIKYRFHRFLREALQSNWEKYVYQVL
jgi:hypothetical protein